MIAIPGRIATAFHNNSLWAWRETSETLLKCRGELLDELIEWCSSQPHRDHRSQKGRGRRLGPAPRSCLLRLNHVESFIDSYIVNNIKKIKNM